MGVCVTDLLFKATIKKVSTFYENKLSENFWRQTEKGEKLSPSFI